MPNVLVLKVPDVMYRNNFWRFLAEIWPKKSHHVMDAACWEEGAEWVLSDVPLQQPENRLSPPSDPQDTVEAPLSQRRGSGTLWDCVAGEGVGEGGVEASGGFWGTQHATYESTSVIFHLCDAHSEVMFISMVVTRRDWEAWKRWKCTL